MSELVYSFDGAAGFFDAIDIGASLVEALDGGDSDFYAAAAGDAVEDDGEAGGVSDFLEVEEEAFLGRAVVVRGDEEDGVCAELLGLLGEVDGFVGAIGAGSGDDFAAACGELDGETDDFDVFFVGEGWGFAGGADGDDTVDACGDLELDKFLEGGDVEFAVEEGGSDSGVDAGEVEVSIHWRIGNFMKKDKLV